MKSILFFLSHQPNPRFIKQINYLAESNQVSVIHFTRATLPDLGSNIAANVRCVSVGQIESSGKYLARAKVYLGALGVLWRCRRQIAAEVVIVNNIDVLLLEVFLRMVMFRPAKIVLEISDLLQHSFARGAAAKVYRLIDRTIVRIFVDRLVVTSLKYYDVYYSAFFHGPYMELENKPLRRNVPQRLEKCARSGLTVIGVVGLIYQAAPIQALFESVKGDDSVEVQIFGRLYDAQNSKALIESYCSKHSNIIYMGAYDFFKDAARIYGGLDLLYVSYDTGETMLNNRVALPNKLYEAMYFRVPIIASKGTYLAEKIIEAGVGYEIDCGSVDQIRRILDDHYVRVQDFEDAFRALPEEFYFADSDYKVFAKFVIGALDGD